MKLTCYLYGCSNSWEGGLFQALWAMWAAKSRAPYVCPYHRDLLPESK